MDLFSTINQYKQIQHPNENRGAVARQASHPSGLSGLNTPNWIYSYFWKKK